METHRFYFLHVDFKQNLTAFTQAAKRALTAKKTAIKHEATQADKKPSERGERKKEEEGRREYSGGLLI